VTLFTSQEDVEFFKRYLDLEELTKQNYISDIKDYSRNINLQYSFPKSLTPAEKYGAYLTQCRKIGIHIEVEDEEDLSLYQSQIWDRKQTATSK
jgi:hypothetical protein